MPEQKWAEFYEFSVRDFATITDLVWRPVDESFTIATFSLEVKLYKMDLKPKPYHRLHRTVESEFVQIFQVLWSPQASNVFFNSQDKPDEYLRFKFREDL